MRLISLLFIFTIFNLSAQTNVPGELVDLDSLDKKKLNLWVLYYTNELRSKRKKESLSNYPALSKAARYHAKYMGYYQYVGHNQQRKGYKTVKERLVTFGGDANFVGENVQMVPVTAWLKNSKVPFTYEVLAEKLVENWRKSKGHYNNMINEHYTGVYHGFYFIDGNLYACQVFSSKPFTPEFEYIKGSPLNIKAKEPCYNCRTTTREIEMDKANIGWYSISNDSVYYENLKTIYYNTKLNFFNRTFNIPHINFNRKIITGKNGIIAVDIIHHSQYNCIGDETFSPELYANGYYIGFIDKGKMKLNNMSTNNAFYKVYVGQVPVFEDPYFQIDFHLTKKHRPCSIYSIIYVKPDYLKPWEYFSISEPVKNQDNVYTVTDSVLLKIPFESGKVSEDPSVFNELISELDRITTSNFNIKKINFTGIASIEGNKEGNKALILQRASAINKIISESYTGLNITSEYIENFDDFRTGLALSNQKSWADSADIVLRKFANRQINNAEIKNLLDQTRQSDVVIVFQKQFTDSVLTLPSINKLTNFIKVENQLNAILTFQILANDALKSKDSLLLDSLIAIQVPATKKWADLKWDLFVLNQKVNHHLATPNELKELYDLGAIKSNAKYLEYKLMYNLFQQNHEFDISDFNTVYESVKTKKTQNWLLALKIIEEDLDFYQDTAFNLQLVQLAIKGRFDQFQTYFVSQYLIRYQYLNEAKLLLKRYAKRKQQFPKLYRQYLKLSYYFEEFEKERELRKNLNIFKNLLQVSEIEFCKIFEWNEMGVSSLKYKQLAELFCATCRTS